MKHYTPPSLVFILIVCLFIATTGFADSGKSSTSSIESNLDGAWGSYVPMYDQISISGSNSSTSTNVLYVASQPKSGGTYKTVKMYVGDTVQNCSYDAATADYRVLLDPSGPLAKGCNGNGRIQN